MAIRHVLAGVALAMLFSSGASFADTTTCQQTDVVVYGGTPAGIAAAIQARRLGKQAMLLEPTGHVGGMMASGLTRTDVSPRHNVYGGIVQEFFDKAISHYQLTDTLRVYFESKWAEQTLLSMAKNAGVAVKFNERVVAVVKPSLAISRIRMTSGNSYCGKVFIDASYEGDLMARSRYVTSTVGRESAATYGEGLAGAQLMQPPTLGNGTQLLVDPFVKPGNAASGLIPGVIAHAQAPVGSADHAVMAYNYRLCVTNRSDNKVPFTKPAGYDPLRYEGLARFLAQLQIHGGVTSIYFIGSSEVLPGKWDVNSNRWFSTDVWNIGYDYITGNDAKRAAIRADIQRYIQGYFWFGQTDPRVPAAVRAYTAQFGYCKDEFTDNHNFPRQLYVREGRRLVGTYVLTQNDIKGRHKFTDSIGLGYAPLDEHGMIRSYKDGHVVDDDRRSVSYGPYEIPYRSLLPKSSEAVNLLVPVGLSASHVAFTSVRMEPSFMVLGQAAGAAAALAPSGRVDKVNITTLRQKLIAAGQVISCDAKKIGSICDKQY